MRRSSRSGRNNGSNRSGRNGRSGGQRGQKGITEKLKRQCQEVKTKVSDWWEEQQENRNDPRRSLRRRRRKKSSATEQQSTTRNGSRVKMKKRRAMLSKQKAELKFRIVLAVIVVCSVVNGWTMLYSAIRGSAVAEPIEIESRAEAKARAREEEISESEALREQRQKKAHAQNRYFRVVNLRFDKAKNILSQTKAGIDNVICMVFLWGMVPWGWPTERAVNFAVALGWEIIILIFSIPLSRYYYKLARGKVKYRDVVDIHDAMNQLREEEAKQKKATENRKDINKWSLEERMAMLEQTLKK